LPFIHESQETPSWRDIVALEMIALSWVLLLVLIPLARKQDFRFIFENQDKY
jgi:hypothetical protein